MSDVEGTLQWPLEHAARYHGAAIGVIDGDRTLTYAELAGRSRRLAGGLDRLGVEPGGRVAVLADNSLEHLECWLGIPAGGRVINDLNFRLAVNELNFIVDDCETRVVVTDDANLELARELRAASAALEQLVYTGSGRCPPDCVSYRSLLDGGEPSPVAIDPGSLAAVSYTGGTTGRPKGVMLTHRNLLANAKHDLIGMTPNGHDRWLHAAPMFHVADTAQTFAMTWVGATHVTMPRFEPSALLRTVERDMVTMTLLVPTMLQALLAQFEGQTPALASLRRVLYGASPIPLDVQADAVTRLPGELIQGYGMTETAPALCFLSYEDHVRGVAGEEPYRARLQSVGLPVPGVQIELRDAHDQEVARGEVGEVTARGPNVMIGYWNDPEQTAQVLRDGWFRTGDLGRLDADGYLTLVDRAKDMIITGGENVYSIEVERALASHPDVVEVAVFGVPDERWGERVHACISVVPGVKLELAAVLEHCRPLIAGYKLPRSLELHSEPLPKSGPGKVLKSQLRQAHWRGRTRQIG